MGPVLGTTLVVYFSYHLVEGDRGLTAWMRLNQEIRQSQATLAQVDAEKEALDRRVNLLRPQHLDRDMLDERARATLNLVAPNERVIFTTPLPH